MILKSNHKKDFDTIYEIINDASIAYKGIIPADRWKEPYMSKKELTTQINEGVEFWNYTEENQILGVMGIQFKNEVALIRHAYVRTSARQKGIGGKLLKHLTDAAKTPILIGTWADASWAISFYIKHGFYQLSGVEKNKLLQTYWSIPERQIETSIVLANKDWEESN
ncbi:GNAT family N-acetyltransferase [Aquimarina sp. I32.4]|uniref:GNAT family N-acetyltransferase n=1 Tax=Aquimarina sp. I32.4 TaxID=2053903 RepID=UPI0018EAA660|nr:GNAT family N-acetyltransferase [Aquimarina sp. I32.4]